MTGFAEDGGLRDEIGSSRINSPRRHTSRSSFFAEAFGGKENQDAEVRSTSAAAAAAAASASPGGDPRGTPSAPRGSKRDAPLFAAARTHLGKLQRGHGTESPFGPPKARLKALQRGDIHAGELDRPAASDRRSGALEIPHRFLPSPTGRSAGDNAWGWNSSCGRGGRGGSGSGSGNGALCGTPWFRAKRRVALRAARARGVPARTPKMLMVPSRLMDSTAASRAAAFTPPTPARPRFVPRRHFVGKPAASTPVPAAPATAGAEGAEKRSAMDSTAAVRRGTLEARAASSGGAGSESERERRGLELVGEFDHEMEASRASVKDASFTPASPTGSLTVALSTPGRRSKSAEGARARLTLVPLERCDGELSRKLEIAPHRHPIYRRRNLLSRPTSQEQARRRSIGDSGGGYPRKRIPSASEARLEISLEALERDDDVLMSPCASASSFSWAGEERASTRKEASTWEGKLGDAVTSSAESSWSMATVDEIDRAHNAMEDRMSSGDPVARTLLTQSDDAAASGGDAIPVVPVASPCAGRPPILGVIGNNAFFQFATTASTSGNDSVAGVGGVRGESMDRVAASTNPFSVAPRGGGAIRKATIFRAAHGAGAGGVPAGTSFGESFGGVCASTEGRSLAAARVTAGAARERRFRPIASPLP